MPRYPGPRRCCCNPRVPGTIETECCGEDLMQEVLKLSILSIDCENAEIAEIDITYDGFLEAWVGESPCGPDTGGGTELGWYLYCVDEAWYLDSTPQSSGCQCDNVVGVVADSFECLPFEAEFTSAGNWHVMITEV